MSLRQREEVQTLLPRCERAGKARERQRSGLEVAVGRTGERREPGAGARETRPPPEEVKRTKKRDPLGWLRRQCRALDGVEERIAWGHPTFRAGGRIIAAFEVVRGRPSIAVLADRDRQEVLIDRFGFFKTPYAGRFGWVSAWVDEPARWDLIADLLEDAYKSAATKRR